MHDEEVHANRRRDHAELAHQHDVDAVPDRIDAERLDDRVGDRDRRHLHRQHVHEHAEDQVEQRQREQHRRRRQAERGHPLGDCVGDAGEADGEVQDERGDDDQQDHAAGARSLQEAGLQHLAGELAHAPDEEQRDEDAERGRLGGRGDAEVEAAHHDAEDDDRRDEVHERAHPVAQRQGRLAHAASREDRAAVDVRHEAQRQQDSRDDAGDEQLADRIVGERPVHDHVDRRRDQDAQRAAGGERAQRTAHRVAARVQRRQCDRADRRRGGNRRAGRGGEQRARADVGVQQAARQSSEPCRERRVHAVGDAGAQQQLAQQHEQRNAGQQVLVERAPHDRRDGIDEGRPESGHAAEDADGGHRDRDGETDEHHPQHHEEDEQRRDRERHAGSRVLDAASAAGRGVAGVPLRCAKSSNSSLTSSFTLFGWKWWLTSSMRPWTSNNTARAA